VKSSNYLIIKEDNMKARNKSIMMGIILLIFLISCNGKINLQPKYTIILTNAPTLTSTITISPTITPTLTVTPTETFTFTSTKTEIPKPASLVGTIYLSNSEKKPFVSLVEIHEKDKFRLIGKSKTDNKGMYKIEEIDPGVYQIWVLITTKKLMVSGCNDIAPTDNSWKIGIKFGEDMSMTIANAYLSKALMFLDNLSSSDMQMQGIYEVLEGFEIQSGSEILLDAILYCI
jgi:hypothetical protein